MSRMRFMNIEIDNLTMDEALDRMEALIAEKKNAFVVTPNVDHLVQIERGGELKQAYDQADLILTDGKPLIWISKWYGTPIREKISGSDLFPRLCERAAARGYRMFFLGAAEGVAAKAAQNLCARYPGLQVVGTYSPPLGFEKNVTELDKAIEAVRVAAPDILIVGLGAPKQELFILRYREKMGVPLSLGLGASLDFEAGSVRRAPSWMADHGLEWLFRLFSDPKRLARRYLVDDRRILGMAIKYKRQGAA